MSAIKPGTRCECRDERCPRQDFAKVLQHGTSSSPFLACLNDAVRMVTVRERCDCDPCREGEPCELDSGGWLDVYYPMCEPCATWHESKEITS